MNINDMIQLIQAVSDHSLTSFELKDGDMKLSIKKEVPQQIVSMAAPVMANQAPAFDCVAGSNQAMPTAAGTVLSQSAAQSQAEGSAILSDKVVTSPLVGTFYNSAGPDKDPFVKVGDAVKKGQVLGIIEAMKLMNEIECEYDGIVDAVLVANEDVVEYGQPLFRIR